MKLQYAVNYSNSYYRYHIINTHTQGQAEKEREKGWDGQRKGFERLHPPAG